MEKALTHNLLMKVQKPARYTGGEYNSSILKSNAEFQFLMCFPDIYEVGMSNLGIKILMDVLNAREDTNCERCFAPWKDMTDLLTEYSIPLFSIDSQRAASEFDMLGFSLQYELSYSAVLKMLSLARIPLLAKDRNQSHPLVIAGGPCTVNPEPFKAFFDVIVIGDGEEVIDKIATEFLKANKDRETFLRAISTVQGVFVPSIHTRADKIKKAVVFNLNEAPFPLSPTVSSIETVHDRVVLEVFRGCTRGCRFCQAGFIYRPIREKTTETLIHQAEQLIKNTGYEEISLSSLSTGDYPDIMNLTKQLGITAHELGAHFGLPSLRIDSFNPGFLPKQRKTLVTFAPEAGTQRLRDVINKNITDEDITNSLTKCFERGYFNIKLYFMTGLPTETREDLSGIVKLCAKARYISRKFLTKGQHLKLTVSTAVFIPKPFTPFQWEAQKDIKSVMDDQLFLKNELVKMGVNYSYHDIYSSRLDAAFARGDERLNQVLINAHKRGCYLDGWSEFFDYQAWSDSFIEAGLDIDDYLKARGIDDELPWDYVDIGITKRFLKKEHEKAHNAIITEDCRNKCTGCGGCTKASQG